MRRGYPESSEARGLMFQLCILIILLHLTINIHKLFVTSIHQHLSFTKDKQHFGNTLNTFCKFRSDVSSISRANEIWFTITIYCIQSTSSMLTLTGPHYMYENYSDANAQPVCRVPWKMLRCIRCEVQKSYNRPMNSQNVDTETKNSSVARAAADSYRLESKAE